ncbi:FG-GAP-like repeat-containing protein [Marinicellulosiphila megalodicopiae]|uniref:FG-GAP-like repeat-containing protein n=1 Tax=Marinicellulosiphila megalodicopiae TaxID=2724896 RepID=UPI003BB10C35
MKTSLIALTCILALSSCYQTPTSNQDTDNDGVRNQFDAFPNDPTETQDSDSDGVGDNKDVFPNDRTESKDSDLDGIGDNKDVFPNDPTEQYDNDLDGLGNNSDAFPNDPFEQKDSDSDGTGDNKDVFPNDPTEQKDSDRDGYGDNIDAFPFDRSEHLDTDSDGYGNNIDRFPNDPTEHADLDNDLIGDNSDTDRDGDLVLNQNDAFPNDPTETKDSDLDGVGDNKDAFPNDNTEWLDSDLDGVGNNADRYDNDPTEQFDTDNDGVGNNADAFPNDQTEWLDSDLDGVGNNADVFDNDPSEQYDNDNDSVGNNADRFDNDPTEQYDTDNDGVGNNSDLFPTDPLEWADFDRDLIGDNSDPDIDNDGVLNASDIDSFNSRQSQVPQFVEGFFHHQSTYNGDTLIDRHLYNIDFDFDGDMDIVGSNYNEQVFLLENNGQGQFDHQLLFTTSLDLNTMQLMDFDKDGDIDFILSANNDSAIWIFDNQYNQRFDDYRFEEYLLVDDLYTGVTFKLADINDDQHLDIIRLLDDNRFVLYTNDGRANFTPNVLLNSGNPVFDFVITDTNSDGLQDIVYSDTELLAIRYLKQDSTGDFTDNFLNTDYYQAAYLTAVDYDADGLVDIIANTSEDLTVIKNHDDDRFFIEQSFAKNVIGTKLSALDVEGDGDLDLFGSVYDQQTAQWLVYDIATDYSLNSDYVQPQMLNGTTINAVAADYDQDGDMDVMATSNNTDFAFYENFGYGTFYQLEGTQTSFKFKALDLDSDSIIYETGFGHDEDLFDIDVYNQTITFRESVYYYGINDSYFVEIIAIEGGYETSKIFEIVIVSDIDLDGLADAQDPDKDGDGVLNIDDADPDNFWVD